MSWITLLLGGISVILFGFIFNLLISKRKILVPFFTLCCTILTVIIAGPLINRLYEAHHFEETIKQYPLFKTIAQTDPMEFKEFITKSKNSINLNESPEKITAHSADLVNKVLPKHMLNASNDAIFSYLNAQLNLLNQLYKIYPELIIKIEMGKPDPALTRLLNSEKFEKLFNELLKTKEQIILSGEVSNNTKINQSASEHSLKQLMLQLNKDFGQENVYLTFSAPNDPNLSQITAARIIIAFYQALIDSGKENAADITKYMYMRR